MKCADTMQAEVERVLKLYRDGPAVSVEIRTKWGSNWDYSACEKTTAAVRIDVRRDSDCAALAARVIADLNAQLESKAT